MTDYSFDAARFGHRARNRFNLVGWLAGALAAARSRRQLDQLDAHLLEDIGVDRKAALDEVRRPVWDVPAHWVE